MNPWHKSHKDRIFGYIRKGDFDSACEAGTIYLNELERAISIEKDPKRLEYLKSRIDSTEKRFILAISYRANILEGPKRWFEGDGWLDHLN